MEGGGFGLQSSLNFNIINKLNDIAKPTVGGSKGSGIDVLAFSRRTATL